MKREPLAAAQMRQVRVFFNVLMNNRFLYSSYDCENSPMEVSRGFAQSLLINVDIHGVVGGL